MKLSIGERFGIGQILPSSGTLIQVRRTRELLDLLTPSEAEIKQHKIRTVDNKTLWENTNDVHDIPLNDVQIKIIAECLERVNTQGKMLVSHIGLYEKFVEKK